MSAQKHKILIAEDDPVSRKIIEAMLSKWGYQIVSMTDGAQAWAHFESNTDIQFVISDWMMPGMDGVEFCKRVRGKPDRRYTYFVLLTAKAQSDDIIEGMDAGADDFITKPFMHNELKARIRAGERVISLENELAEKIAEISRANEQMEQDLEASAATLMGMLPPASGSYPGLDYSFCFNPCSRIGGDLLNLIPIANGIFGIYIFDVSGHGVPSALQAVSMGHILSPHDPEAGLLTRYDKFTDRRVISSPSEVITALNSWFEFSNSGSKFTTFLYGIIDLNRRTFTFSRAGHQPPAIIRDGELLQIPPTTGIPIGIMSSAEYDEASVTLEKGDRLFLYTDGLFEAQNGDGVLYGEERMLDYLRSHPARSIGETISDFVSEVAKWEDRDVKEDDQTIIGLQYNGL